MSARFDQAQYEAHQRKHGFLQVAAETVAERPQQSRLNRLDAVAEKKLQGQFEQWLRLHNYLYYRVPMYRASSLPVGFPDFQVWLPHGRCFFVEYKTETGRLSPEQVAYHARLAERDFRVFVCRRLEEAIAAVREMEHPALHTQPENA